MYQSESSSAASGGGALSSGDIVSIFYDPYENALSNINVDYSAGYDSVIDNYRKSIEDYAASQEDSSLENSEEDLDSVDENDSLEEDNTQGTTGDNDSAGATGDEAPQGDGSNGEVPEGEGNTTGDEAPQGDGSNGEVPEGEGNTTGDEAPQGDGSNGEVPEGEGNTTGDKAPQGDGSNGEVPEGGDVIQVLHKDEIREDFDANGIAASLHKSIIGAVDARVRNSLFEKYFDGNSEYKALNDAELEAVAIAYEEKYGKDLEDAIKSEFAYDIENKYVSRVRNATEIITFVNENGEEVSKYFGELTVDDISKDLLIQIADKFDKATVDICGTDEDVVWQIMTLDSDVLSEIIKYYNNSPRADFGDFESILKSEFFATFGRGKILEMYNEAVN